MPARKPNVMVIAAHPDDAEGKAGGTAALFRKNGNRVKFLYMTNGDTGHQGMGGMELARRRCAEARKSAAIIGAECTVLDIHNNELEPCLHYRKLLIEEIRKFQAEIIITHRTNDYHPDHRYTGQLARDAANGAHLPNVCPLTPELKKKPVTLYAYDGFTKPVAFSADIAVNIDPVAGTKLDMWHCHTSQMYEWLPYETGRSKKVPSGEKARKKWLAEWRFPGMAAMADRYRDELIERYGKKDGGKIKYAEVFEISEYGSGLDKRKIRTYFPF